MCLRLCLRLRLCLCLRPRLRLLLRLRLRLLLRPRLRLLLRLRLCLCLYNQPYFNAYLVAVAEHLNRKARLKYNQLLL
jgi:hypothetical protein